MSKGAGRVQAAILTLLDSNPSGAFDVEDIAAVAYPGCNRLEKKHRVSIARAIRKVVSLRPDVEIERGQARGGPVILYKPADVRSYSMMRLKAHRLVFQPPTDRAIRERYFADLLAPGGKYADYLKPGGSWWLHTQIAIAKRDGDSAGLVDLQSQQEANRNRIVERLREH